MSQLIDNLNTIESVKTDIKSAIEAKGVDMTGVSFSGYASKIGEISGGGGVNPSGTLNISENGVYNVYSYASVSVDVPPISGWDQKSLTEGTVEITNIDNSASFVASSAFYNNINIQTVNLPYATSVGNFAFYSCKSLNQVSLPVCSFIGNNAFRYCYQLSQVNLPICKFLEGSVFQDCNTLNSIYLPVASIIGSYCFNNCRSLLSIMLPECITLENNIFTGCQTLSTIVLPKLQTIGTSVFRVLRNQPEYMVSLYMGGSDVVNTGSAVASTLFFDNVQKNIYVRSSLIDMYQQHSIWGQINNVQWFNYEDSPYYTE